MIKVLAVSVMKTAMQDSQTASNACFRSGCGQNKAEACSQTQKDLTRQQARKQAKLNRFRLYGRIPKESKLIKVYCAAVYAAIEQGQAVGCFPSNNDSIEQQKQKDRCGFSENLCRKSRQCNLIELPDLICPEKHKFDYELDDLLQSDFQRQKDLKESWERSYEKYNKAADFGKNNETRQIN